MVEPISTVAEPIPGFYAVRRMGRPDRAVRIWFGPPSDPITGEALDRSWRWQADVDGRTIDDVNRVWPWCARDPITQETHDFIVAQTRAAKVLMPGSPLAERNKRVDYETAPLV